MAGRLQGKVALISGTAVGLGRAAAQVFAAEGALVFGCDMDIEGQAHTEALVSKAGGRSPAAAGWSSTSPRWPLCGAPPSHR